MRLLLTLHCPRLVPFDHLPILKAAFHRWTGFVPHLHQGLAMYSLSWLQGGQLDSRKRGLHFPGGAHWAISAPDTKLLKHLLAEVRRAPQVGAFDMRVTEVTQVPVPAFQDGEQRFELLSPILLRDFTPPGTRTQPQLSYRDPGADKVLTHVLHRKLAHAGIDPTGAAASFDQQAEGARVRMMRYGQTRNVLSDCAVYVRGTAQQLSLAWCTGLGHSTGIGCGSLR